VADTHNSIRVPLGGLTPIDWAPERRGEPIKIGIPLPAGGAFSPADIELDPPFRLASALQVRALDSWPDGSIRWALVDALADTGTDGASGSGATGDSRDAGTTVHKVRVSAGAGAVSIDTGIATFRFETGGSFPFASISVGDAHPVDAEASGLRVAIGDRLLAFRIGDVRVQESGPVRAEIELRAVAPDASPLDVLGRVELFAGSATARVEITLLNRRRAQHANGEWILGDKGSLHLRSAAVLLTSADDIRRVRCAPEAGMPLADVTPPFEIYQESSGGEHWNGAIHRNREGQVPMRFRGYRLRSGGAERTALRASPLVTVETDRAGMAVTLPQFWQHFPRAIGVEGRTIEIGLFPRQAADTYELQGGEQKTHVLVVAFATDRVSDPPLAWCHDPLLVYPPPAWCCATGAVAGLIPAADDPNRSYRDLVNLGLDPVTGFERKRERADEYGWRNYGDLHGDHESAFQPPDQPFVSHYNNQYDAVAGFAMQFLTTGEPRWWQLMIDLARHVRDIDIYRTREDKTAYSGGLFWHTCHYTDAGTSTHRTYPRGMPGGGPGSEHNYNAGLMLHYFMTGERASRDSAIALGRWVIEMDDGRRTVFRWLAGGATGLASASGSTGYHGPGRGAANSILACLVAARLSKAPEFRAKAEELIKRCIHPQDDLEARNLLDTERRWFYTIFLQVLGTYLQIKEECRECDDMHAYARASLLHYARWMVANERPYLERPEVLEFPTETWAAQDIRKAEVFLWAARHSSGVEREQFLERARFFFDYSVSFLTASATRHLTRPVVLLLSNGFRYGWFQQQAASLQSREPAPAFTGPPPRLFEPQKLRALRRAAQGAILAGLAAIAGLVVWFW
jgi:hypothetical protein